MTGFAWVRPSRHHGSISGRRQHERSIRDWNPYCSTHSANFDVDAPIRLQASDECCVGCFALAIGGPCNRRILTLSGGRDLSAIEMPRGHKISLDRFCPLGGKLLVIGTGTQPISVPLDGHNVELGASQVPYKGIQCGTALGTYNRLVKRKK